MERSLLREPVIVFFAGQDAQPGRAGQRPDIGDGIPGRQLRRFAAAPLPGGDHRPAARAKDPGYLTHQPALVGNQLQGVDAHDGVRRRGRQRGIRGISDDERRLRAGHEKPCPPRRLRDRTGREIDPGQAGTGYAREPQPDPATTAAQIEEAMAWLEPQLRQDAIQASTRNERERLYARRKGAENLIENLIRRGCRR